ncbi:DUF6600 domain-containing protein [Cupriavidus basilensis]|uniref:DUF6600 domain-containing protein n=1 Tax=Cupriavidus basilensis TaxID=68895 RepID=UPI0007511BE4
MFPARRLGPGARALLLAIGIACATWLAPALAQSADPSDRIATITDAAGSLSLAPAGSDDWAQAALNRPITTGDRLWVDNGGRAELHAGSTAIRLGGATAATVLNLDDSATQVKLTQGTLQLRVRALPPDQPVEIDTPNLAFVPREPGDYRLDVAADGSATVVTMHHGSAVVYGESRSREMRRGEQIRFAGSDLAEAGTAFNPPEDEFDRWTTARDAREDASPSAMYVPPEMTGYAALDGYGDWQEDPGYGAVWFPRVVAADWAPYSTGSWAWVAPWGWTWCDEAPWGFAPFHYGRWARIGSRWGWMPGPRAVRPVYAPALVGFVGGGRGGPGVAWYPLGPHESYRPAYGASAAYLGRVNRFTVNREFANDRARGAYANRDVPGAITGMPARAFVQGQRVPPGARHEAWRDLPRGEANGAPPLAPVKASLLGARPGRPAPPAVVQGFARPAIAVRAPGRPAGDELAQRLARGGGTVPGAGPAWRGGNAQPAGPAAAGGQVRLSQAAPAWRGRGEGGQANPANPANPAFNPQRTEGGPRGAMPQGFVGAAPGGQPPAPGGDPRARGWTTRPDQAREQQAMQQQQAIRQQQDMQREQLDRQRGDQFHAQQALQQQQDMQRQQQARQFGDQQRAQQALQQQQDMQRQQQARQFGDQQRAQQAIQQQQEMQRQQQARQLGDQQRAQQALQQQQEMQRQQQARQLGDQQRAQQALQQQQEMQRQQLERQRGEQQRAQQALQQQQAMQRQQQETQRQQMEQQRMQMRQQQERQVQEQQRQQQVMERQQQEQMQRQQQEMQRQQQNMQRQQQEQQRRQQELQRQQQHT